MRPIDGDALHAKICKDSENNYGASLNIAQVLLYIETAPTVEAELVRHGQWIEDTEPDEDGNVISMCNQCYHIDEHGKNIKIQYCWYCGAKMYEGDEQ